MSDPLEALRLDGRVLVVSGGAPERLAYASSKGALATLTRNAGGRLRADRIRVNGLNIAWTATAGEHVVQTGEGEADIPA